MFERLGKYRGLKIGLVGYVVVMTAVVIGLKYKSLLTIGTIVAMAIIGWLIMILGGIYIYRDLTAKRSKAKAGRKPIVNQSRGK